MAKGCTNTVWLYTPVIRNPDQNLHSPYNYAPFGVLELAPFKLLNCKKGDDSVLKNIAFEPEGTAIDPDHGRFDR
ncbi:hypothetical protein EVAR_5978_1 [Eumeta japonica]|uniref:Uncharacterized protein n=1 Tax=Eumeta variegata TaxID=151549 RepID=A0A4C1T9D4_EUMVA|nr:hypothetical protein EVAR_5978_1 [Eumeta japonica]